MGVGESHEGLARPTPSHNNFNYLKNISVPDPISEAFKDPLTL